MTLDIDTHANGDTSDKIATVVDDENYSHNRRLKAIHDARDRVIDVRNAVAEHQIQRSLSDSQALAFYRRAVEGYVLESLPVLRSEDVGSEDYLEGVELGEVVFRPSDSFVAEAKASVGRLAPGCSVPAATAVTIEGVEAILSLPSPLQHRFTYAVVQGRQDFETRSEVVSTELPRDVLDAALQAIDEALDEANIGLDIESQDREAFFEYSDLIPRDDPEGGD